VNRFSATTCGAFAIAAIATLILGCGAPSGPPRYDLEGSVTYGGKPVPAGRVVLEPDSDKGNSGPASYGEIKDGRYVTEPGKGTVGGPHVARISGTDGVPQAEVPQGLPLFGEYRTTVDLPRQSASHDFDVPATHK